MPLSQPARPPTPTTPPTTPTPLPTTPAPAPAPIPTPPPPLEAVLYSAGLPLPEVLKSQRLSKSKRDLLQRQKRPTTEAKETYCRGKTQKALSSAQSLSFKKKILRKVLLRICALAMTCLPRVARGSGQMCGESVGRAVLPPARPAFPAFPAFPPSLLLPGRVSRPGPAHPAFPVHPAFPAFLARPALPAFPAAGEEKASAQARHCHGEGKQRGGGEVLKSQCSIPSGL